MKAWFFRFTAVHFVVTALTGLVLYFRPGGRRPGLYSEAVKEWLVMIHNGEWLSYVLFGRPFLSGLIFGIALSATLVTFSVTRRRDSMEVQLSAMSPPPSAQARAQSWRKADC